MSFLKPVDSQSQSLSSIQYLTRTPDFNGEDLKTTRAEVMELLIDAQMMRDNAQTLDHFKEEMFPNIVRELKRALLIMFQIGSTPRSTARSMYTFERVPSEGNPTQFCAFRIRLWYQDEKSDSMSKRINDLLTQNGNLLHRHRVGVQDPPPPPPPASSSSSSSSSRDSAAGGGGGEGEGEDSSSSSSRPPRPIPGGHTQPARYQPRPLKSLGAHQNVTLRDWVAMVAALHGGARQPADLAAILAMDNIHYPRNAFAIENSLVKARNLGAHPRYCTIDNYFVYGPNYKRTGYRWPDPKNVWAVAGEEITPQNYTQRFLPWIPIPKSTLNREREVHLVQSRRLQAEDIKQLVKSDPAAKLYVKRFHQDRKHCLTEEEKQEVYDNRTNKVASDTTLLDIHKMKAINAAQFKEIDRCVASGDGGVDENMLFVRLRQARSEMLKSFHEHLWTEDGHIPAAMKCIVKAFNEHLKNHSNFNMPRKKISSNLSRLADTLASFAVELEVVHGVNTVHQQVTACLLRALEVYSGEPMHSNTCLTGPPRAGKTFTFTQLLNMLITGTMQMYTDCTPKSKTADSDMFGKEYTHMIEPPSPGTSQRLNPLIRHCGILTIELRRLTLSLSLSSLSFLFCYRSSH
jgi:hypothetical protein